MKTAKVYAVQKIGPVNIGAGNNDYIHKAFGRISEPPYEIAIVTQVTPATYESLAQALLTTRTGEVAVDPSQVLGVEVTSSVGGPGEGEAIAAVRAKSVRIT